MTLRSILLCAALALSAEVAMAHHNITPARAGIGLLSDSSHDASVVSTADVSTEQHDALSSMPVSGLDATHRHASATKGNPMSDFQKPTTGRIVHYRLATDTDVKPVYRPATVVRTWPESSEDMYNIVVTLDGDNDRRHGVTEAEALNCKTWRTSVHFGDVDGTWCWPPRS